MQHEPKVLLIGGTSHGHFIDIDKNTNEIEIDVHTTGAPTPDSTFTEEYRRRHFDGDGFGEGFDCFVLKSDDDTEQKELARWSLKHPSTPSEDSGRF